MGLKKVADQFWNLNLIKEPADIFDLNYGKIKLLKDGENYQSII